jgi:hypothetical protein
VPALPIRKLTARAASDEPDGTRSPADRSGLLVQGNRKGPGCGHEPGARLKNMRRLCARFVVAAGRALGPTDAMICACAGFSVLLWLVRRPRLRSGLCSLAQLVQDSCSARPTFGVACDGNMGYNRIFIGERTCIGWLPIEKVTPVQQKRLADKAKRNPARVHAPLLDRTACPQPAQRNLIRITSLYLHSTIHMRPWIIFASDTHPIASIGRSSSNPAAAFSG